MFLTKKLNVKFNNLNNTRFEFKILSKDKRNYLTENFEQFCHQKPDPYLYSTYRTTETASSIEDHAIYLSNNLYPIYLVASIDNDKWKKLNDKRLILKNILNKDANKLLNSTFI